jgi:hypothetical protein
MAGVRTMVPARGIEAVEGMYGVGYNGGSDEERVKVEKESFLERQIKTSVLKIVIENRVERNNIHGKSLINILNSIKKLAVNINIKDGRYSSSNTGNELAIIFADEIKNSYFKPDNVILGLFLKRRGNNRPWEDDGTGNIIALTLKDETHEIAEVSYFAIDINTGALFWTYNPLVGGIGQFLDYLNGRMNILQSRNLLENIPEKDKPDKRLGLYYIGYPDSLLTFKDKMEVIKSFEFHLAGDAEFLSQAFLFNDSARDKTGMHLLREFTKKSNCAQITINIKAEKNKKSKNKREARGYSLNKNFLIDMYENTIDHLRSKKDSKFNVKGELIDEDTRVLDLVHSRLVYTMNVELDDSMEIYKLFLNALMKLIINKINEVKRYYNNEVD